jgi:hypothetical protein
MTICLFPPQIKLPAMVAFQRVWWFSAMVYELAPGLESPQIPQLATTGRFLHSARMGVRGPAKNAVWYSRKSALPVFFARMERNHGTR